MGLSGSDYRDGSVEAFDKSLDGTRAVLGSMTHKLVNVDVDANVIPPSSYSIDTSRDKQRDEEFGPITFFLPHHLSA